MIPLISLIPLIPLITPSDPSDNTLKKAIPLKSDDNNTGSTRRVPAWMYFIIALCMIPGLCFPWAVSLLQDPNPIVRGLVWFYPAYVLLSCFLAWQCYGRRTVMTWIVLVLLVLSHAGFYTLTFLSPN